HQRDGSFGTLTGGGSRSGAPLEFTEEEIYAIEEHRFAPITHLFWREAEPRFDSLPALIADLEARPRDEALRPAPQAIDLAVLKRLAEEPIADTVRGAGAVRRFWEACSLPDFRSVGVDSHARFVARLWDDLQEGYLGADFVAARIAELDRVQGDIDTLQGRIAAIRSWAYICQRPDWVLARDEMASRARGVEAKLSDALHARLTERFVNRRTTILMKSLGQDAAALPVTLEPDGRVTVEGEPIGRLEGFRFTVDPDATLADRKMLLAAGERALPGILAQRAERLLGEGLDELDIERGTLAWNGHRLATIVMPDDFSAARLEFAREVTMLPDAARVRLEEGLGAWLAARLEPLAPLRKLAQAARDPEAGSQARALLITLIEAGGVVSREKAGLEHLPKEMRPFLRRLGVTFGALDIFAAPLLKPAPRSLLHALGLDRRPLNEAMLPVLSETKRLPAGYRPAGTQAIRVDLAEKILRAAFEARSRATERAAKGEAPEPRKGRHSVRFRFDLALAVSIGLEEDNARRLLGSAGFRYHRSRDLAEGAFGPPAPDSWTWRPRRAGDARRPHDKGREKGRDKGHDHSRDGSKDKRRHPRKDVARPARKGAAPHDRRETPAKPDTGPARSGGAFDGLAELLGGKAGQ
ncbi:MAG: helicase, partial [Erythrobacter sp.]